MLEVLSQKKIIRSLVVFLLLLSLFIAVQVLKDLKEYQFIGSGVVPQNTISVSGKGEVFAVSDIGTVSFSVIQEEKTVTAAQDFVTKKIDLALSALKKDFKIDEKDIKTLSYNIYPTYDYSQGPCSQFSCPPSRQVLRGYEVSQTIQVKIRKVSDAGAILGALGNLEVSNIGGLEFTIDDEDQLVRQARQKAIDDAKEKARELSKDLGVRLVRIISFSEGGGYPIAYMAKANLDEGAVGIGGATPDIPTGENKITSNVTITYEIR